MKKNMLISVVCTMALLFTAGCSGSEGSGSGQQNNDPAVVTESTTEPVSEGNGSGQQNNDPAVVTESTTEPVSEEISEVTGEEPMETAAAEGSDSVSEGDSPVVYFTSDITAEGLVKIYEALDWTPEGNVAVKISTGEPPASNYLRPELIGDLVRTVDGTIVECNTAYGGSRSGSAMHKQVAEDHGFTDIADFDLMDEEGEVEWPMTGGTIPLLQQWLWEGMSLGSAAAFMITGPATKITNLGALKIAMGWKRFAMYIFFVMMYSFLCGIVVNLVV